MIVKIADVRVERMSEVSGREFENELVRLVAPNHFDQCKFARCTFFIESLEAVPTFRYCLIEDCRLAGDDAAVAAFREKCYDLPWVA